MIIYISSTISFLDFYSSDLIISYFIFCRIDSQEKRKLEQQIIQLQNEKLSLQQSNSALLQDWNHAKDEMIAKQKQYEAKILQLECD